MSNEADAKRAWNARNPERQRVYTAIYRAKKKGIEPAPELLAKMAEWKAEKEAKKVSKADRKERDRRYHRKPEVRAREVARRREKYQNDPEYRAKCKARCRERYYGSKIELTPERKAEWDRLRREALAKGRKTANAKRVAEAIVKGEERKRVEAERKKAQALLPKPAKSKHVHRKPGRLTALMGWRGW